MTGFVPIIPPIIGSKRTRSNENVSRRIDIRRIIDNGGSTSSSSNNSNDIRRIIYNGSSTSSISSNSFGNESSECSSWKVKYEDEQEKNTLLNLQLCYVQSECQRMLQLQSEIATSISTLQDSLTSWIDDIGSDEEESDTDEEPLDDVTIVISDDSMSESGTDEEDELRPSKSSKNSLCNPYF
mmetsp:Transcript_26174/g.25014  ORF Transcript_26174/g.25014 Transcript_26174/m.25014 type:complete len:183 (+) Transcript_26174:56-604(+)|eukprot:CAMPEP_0119042740 /NCGR_PEP_ID=MMETSP1177-20130426/16120_1 /TAXON_ID=2985 /ORGANISM="Ochromonas sp, Strain CCMP1899" /LENGTH=182 /DNA_ID=CAMNT_0007009727 /DNA_START=31 /DNA_END=579 /DNA_ORIENTATION=-